MGKWARVHRARQRSRGVNDPPDASGRTGPEADAAAGLAGLGVPRLEIPVDVDVPHPERAPNPHRGKVAGPDEPVDRHRRNPHELRDFLNCQKARFLERLRHAFTPISTRHSRGYALLGQLSRAGSAPHEGFHAAETRCDHNA